MDNWRSLTVKMSLSHIKLSYKYQDQGQTLTRAKSVWYTKVATNKNKKSPVCLSGDLCVLEKFAM